MKLLTQFNVRHVALFSIGFLIGIAGGWGICSFKSQMERRSTTISELNNRLNVIGETGLPLGKIMTLRGKIVVAARRKDGDGGLESKIRIFLIDNVKPDKQIDLPIVSFDGVKIPNDEENMVVVQGYERLEEIGYSKSHWQLYGQNWDERIRNGEEYDPAMCAYPREIRSYFLCLSLKVEPMTSVTH